MELWYTQDYIENYQMSLKVRETIYRGRSPYQEIAVVRTELYGNLLLLDGIAQTSEKDEFMYHEMLVHPAMLTHPDPQRVLVIGGGDGGAAREVLRHPVRSVVMVEIDGEVIEVSRRHLPALGNWDDARLKVLVEDGIAYMTNAREEFDCIILDSTDPLPQGPAEGLFTREFYQNAFTRLSPEGTLVSQIEPPFFHPDSVSTLWDYLSMFPVVKLFWGMVPIYPGGVWTYIIASKRNDPEKVSRPLPFPTRYYTPDVHRGAFALPRFLADAFQRRA
ncbi:MAG TPA: polyamine aminopropyltransferase [Atribacteraceae bacterium]|nr:polyamine aminopropyltransferase [Atribacteraceae bacterium]